MRLRRLLIEDYGPFGRADLHLNAEPGALNLVVAPNGAGKSVLRHAFHDLLFDIPMRSPMQFRFPYKGMRLHAEAIASDGTAFEFGWTRGAKPERATTDPARYAALRAETTPRQLEQLFALDTERLRKGGLDLQGGTTLAGALLSGTGELASARRVQTDLAARREANYGRRKSTPPLNLALRALGEARKAALAAVQRPTHREQQQQRLDEAKQAAEEARAAQRQAQQAAERLNRIARVREHLDALTAAETWFAANPTAPALPPGLDQQLADARGTLATAHTVAAKAAERLQQAEAQLALIPQDAAVLAHQAALRRLPGQLGSVEDAMRDAVQLRAEHASKLTGIGAALRDIGATVPPEQAGGLLPPSPALAAARAAITAHAGHRTAEAIARRKAADAGQRLEAAKAAPAPGGDAPDGLAALVREIAADRNPITYMLELEAAARRSGAALAAALAKVPGWSGGADGLLAMAPPLEAECERLDQARAAAATAAHDAARARDDLATKLGQTRTELASQRGQALPDAAAIAAARTRRDHGWALIARRLFEGVPDQAAEQAYAGALPLPLAFARDLHAADDLADRRIAELDRVNAAERLTREAATLETVHAQATAIAAAAAEQAQAARAAWATAIAPLGLDQHATLKDLRVVVAARAAVADAVQAEQLAQGDAAATADRQQAWANRLADLLDVTAAPLATLLPAAEARLTYAQAARQQAAAVTAERKAAADSHQVAERELREAEQASATWRADWARVLAMLNRPADEPPEATAAVLDRLTEIGGLHQEATSLADRITAIEADAAAFGATVRDLATALGIPLDDPAAQVARALIARANLAAANDSARQQAEANHQAAQDEHARAAREADAAQLAFDAVVAATGAGSEAEATTRIAAAREHARNAGFRDRAQAGLRDHGDGRPRGALQEEASSISADAMAAAREQAGQDAAAANDRAANAAVALHTIQREFDADAETTAALEAAGNQAAAAAAFGRLLEEQLLLQVADAMLGQALEAVEQDAGDTGLARISAAFAALTAGAYGVVLSDQDNATLLAIEHRFPNEKKTLEQLSEGTRDQLYLALRIVALREHAAGATPLPFIADDILQTFDDARATAALHALLDLSHAVQVILLTHHEHLGHLAAALPPGRVTVQRL